VRSSSIEGFDGRKTTTSTNYRSLPLPLSLDSKMKNKYYARYGGANPDNNFFFSPSLSPLPTPP